MRGQRRLSPSLITAAALSVFLGCGPGSHREADVGLPSAAALVGLWQGFSYIEGHENRVEIEITQNFEGELVGVADFRDSGSLGVPLEVELADDTVILSTGSGSLFEGRLLDDLGAIQGQLFAGTMGAWYSLALEKDNPAFRRFELPRLTENGEAQSEYSYRPPEESENGWPVSTLAAESIDEGKIAGLVESVFREEHGHPEAILIARNGKLVLEEYFYGYSRDRIHSIQSATKSVTSLLFGIARDRGHVGDLDQPVYTFFPEYQGKKWIDRQYPITLAHLLTMSAAIEWNNDASSDADGGEAGWQRLTRIDDWIGYVLDLDQVGRPGEVASYNTGLSTLLGGVIRNATGKYADEFAEETLFADLHVSSYRWLKAADGTRETGGGLRVTAYDLAKMGQLVLDKGRWNGKQVVSDTWIAESVKRHLPLAEGAQSPYATGFAYHWWNQSYEVGGMTIRAIVGRGYGGQYLGIFPTLNTVVVMNNGEMGGPRERVFDYDVIVEEWILPAIG
ncbi:MAG: serine hydrolase [candidate division NC10 bacterium]